MSRQRSLCHDGHDLRLVETGKAKQLTNGAGAGKASFSKDGMFMVFGADHEGNGRLFRANTDDSDPQLIEK